MSRENCVSVIITTYNSAEYIVTAIESVIKQCSVNIEIIIVDDCSNDFKLLECNVARYSDRYKITILQPEVKGNANISRNIGIKKAIYNYVAFLDADDTWNEQHLISCLHTMKEQSLDACFGRVNLIADQVVNKALPVYKTRTDICKFIFVHGGILVTSSLLIKKETLLSISFDNNLFKHQDWDFLIRYTHQFILGQSDYYGLNYSLSTGSNMSSTFNFNASISFMNNTLPEQWHNIFITSTIKKIIDENRYCDLVVLRTNLNSRYKKTINFLALNHQLILLSAKSKVLFKTIYYGFRITNSIKNLIRLLK